METKEKMTPAQWFENVWYHYKWQIIVGFLMIIFLAVSLLQCSQNDEPDVNILHVGPFYISPAAVTEIENTLGKLCDDYNGDGEFNADLLDITVNKFGNESAGVDVTNYDYQKNAYTRFQTEIRAGDAVIYLLDEEYFNICIQEGLLTPLNEVLDDAYLPEVNEGYGEYGVYLSNLDAYELPGLCEVPATAILCLRRLPKEGEVNFGNIEKVWEGNKKAFINIFKYKSTKKDTESNK